MMTVERVHYLLMRHIIETGHAPDLSEAARLIGGSEEEAAEWLKRLMEIRGLTLEPDSTRIWSLHPFALVPASFWVSAGERGWWANCAWCSVGIGAAIGEDVRISTFDGGEGEPLTFEIKGGVSSRDDLWMNFPYPPARWWDNPYCPCGNILFFSSPEKIAAWSRRHGRPMGSALEIGRAVRLGQLWFGDYASPDWKRKNADQAGAVFAELGLDPAFWRI